MDIFCRQCARNDIVEEYKIPPLWGESSRYDFVVETGGRFLRVQVKSTNAIRGKNYICATVDANQKAYNSEEIDFFACYIIPVDTWYLVPIDHARNARRGLCFSPHNSLSKHAVYREAWHLLRGEGLVKAGEAEEPKGPGEVQPNSESAG